MDTYKEKFNENSRNKLVASIRKEVTHMMEQTLDFSQVACSKDNYPQLRSKILRVGNDCMRTLEKELNAYDVQFNRINEEVIEFSNNKKDKEIYNGK